MGAWLGEGGAGSLEEALGFGGELERAEPLEHGAARACVRFGFGFGFGLLSTALLVPPIGLGLG